MAVRNRGFKSVALFIIATTSLVNPRISKQSSFDQVFGRGINVTDRLRV